MKNSFYTQAPPGGKQKLLASGYYSDGKEVKGKSNKVLLQETTKLKLTPYIDNSAALGVFITKRGEQTYFQHTGADEGFVSLKMTSFPENSPLVLYS